MDPSGACGAWSGWAGCSVGDGPTWFLDHLDQYKPVQQLRKLFSSLERVGQTLDRCNWSNNSLLVTEC